MVAAAGTVAAAGVSDRWDSSGATDRYNYLTSYAAPETLLIPANSASPFAQPGKIFADCCARPEKLSGAVSSGHSDCVNRPPPAGGNIKVMQKE